MTIRSLIILTVIFAVVGFGIYVAQLNRAAVTLDLPGMEPIVAPLWAVCFLSLLAGVFLALFYSLVLSSREAFQRWQNRREEERIAEIAGIFRSGMDEALQGRLHGALERFEEVTERDPEHVEAWLIGGEVARRLGDADRAVEMHQRAQALAPQDARVLECLSADYEDLDDLSRARRYLEQRLEMDPPADAETYESLRDLLARQGRWSAAEEVQEQRLKMAGDPDVRRREEAILRGIRFEVGRSLLQEGDEQAAAKVFEKLIKSDESFVPAYVYLGEARLAADEADPEAAAEAWRRGFEKTRSLGLLERKIEHHLQQERPDSAIGALRRAIDALEGNAALAARFLLGRLYFRLEMVEEAEAEFLAIEEDVEFSPVLEYYLGRLRQRRGDHAGAAEAFQEILRKSGHLDEVYRCKACGATHASYTSRCRSCHRWGQVDFDTTRTTRVEDARPVQVPHI